MKTLTSIFRATEELSSFSPVDPDPSIGRVAGIAWRCRHGAAGACVCDGVADASFVAAVLAG